MARKKGKQTKRNAPPSKMEEVPGTLNQLVNATKLGDFPKPADIPKIIKRRETLMYEMMNEMMQGGKQNQQERAMRYVAKYGARDVTVVLKGIQETFFRPYAQLGHAHTYRSYRRAFARWGGSRRFLPQVEQEELSMEYVLMNMRREKQQILPLPASKREAELADVTLAGHHFFEDLLPAAVPPRPADFQAPQPAEYPLVIDSLLEIGPVVDPRGFYQMITNERQNWLLSADVLIQMALDEGLRAGWPGEKASWAPEHALEALKIVKAYEGTIALAELAVRPDDWLSDRVPDVWAAANGPIEEDLLNAIADGDNKPLRAAVLCAGLHGRAKAKPATRKAIVGRLVEVLKQPKSDADLVDGYIIDALKELDAVEAKDAILAAFATGQVDEEIVSKDDIPFLK